MNKVLSCLLPAAAIALLSATAAAAAPFNGPYVGAALGMDNYEIQANDFFYEGTNFDGLSANGAVLSLYTGYDYAFGTKGFVGIEAALDLSGAELSVSDSDYAAKLKAKESYSLAGRLGGMINESTGLYGRLGWVNTKFKETADDYADSGNESGWLYGVGIETALKTSTTLRAEYNIVDYGDVGPDNVLTAKNSQFKVGVSYRF